MNRFSSLLASVRPTTAARTVTAALLALATACGGTTTPAAGSGPALDTGATGDVTTSGDAAGGGDDSAATGNDSAVLTDGTVSGGSDAAGTDGGGKDAAKDAGKDILKKDTGPVVDKDNTPDGAAPVEVGTSAAPSQPASDTLDPTGDVDFFSFEGKKGQIAVVFIQAQALTTAFDPDTLDTIITLYGPDKKTPIGFNDDPPGRQNNDSELWTYLPENGTYYVRVEECWTWLEAHPQGNDVSCADPKEKGNTDYNISVGVFDDKDSGIVVDLEKGDTLGEATELPFEKNAQGKYMLMMVVGTFKGLVDIDVYHFKTPADMTVTQGRSVNFFEMHKAGPEGDGSTALMGSAWIASEATPTVMIAQSDLGKTTSISPPLTFGVGYFLFVSRAAGAATANEFYFIDASAGGSNPVEANDKGNDLASGAEAIATKANSFGSQQGFCEGDLPGGGKDVDWYSVKVPASAAGGKFYVYCDAQASGSGLRGFKVEAFTDAGTTPLANGSQVEAGDGVAIKEAISPSGGSTVYLKLSAASQAADVTSTFYRCGVALAAP